MIVLCDVDGVIADLVKGVLDAIYDATGMRHDPEDVTQWDIKAALGLSDTTWRTVTRRIAEPGFAYHLDAYPDAVAGVKAVAELAEVVFVTSPWLSSPTWAHDRTEWLVRHFGREQGRKVIHTAEKHHVRGDMLIDDKPETLKNWPGAWPMLWECPHNRVVELVPMRVCRVSTWPEVLNVVLQDVDHG